MKPPSLPQSDLGWKTRAEIVRVLDADTIEALVSRTFHVRLLDCWAPERHHTQHPGEKEWGIKATDYVRRLLQTKDTRPVALFIPADQNGDLTHVTSMGRVLGRVYLEDGRELAAVIRKAGHAFRTKEELTRALEALTCRGTRSS